MIVCNLALNLMLQNLNNFDPIKFLSIKTASLSAKNIESLKNKLNEKIGAYVLLAFSQYFKDDEFEQLTAQDGQEMLLKLRRVVPDMDNKLLMELENFRKDYQGAHRGGRRHA